MQPAQSEEHSQQKWAYTKNKALLKFDSLVLTSIGLKVITKKKKTFWGLNVLS